MSWEGTSLSCLWLSEEYERQMLEKKKEAEAVSAVFDFSFQVRDENGKMVNNPFLTITMPNGDVFDFDLCLQHGEIRAIGKRQ
jgi:hypothetical protein